MDNSKIRNLIDKLNYHTKLYDEGKPEISDQMWDEMYFELVNLEQQTGKYYEDSPTQRISFQILNDLTKVKHNHLMLSLDKTKDLEEIKSFINGKETIAMSKMDGLTCSLKYINGKLVSAETRGNGEIGEDILHNALQIKNIPKKINYKNELIVDGEVICTYDNFERFKNVYKNPRNFASGSIRLLDSKECYYRNLSFVAWDAITAIENTLAKKLQKLEELGFYTVPYTRVIEETIEDALEIITVQSNLHSYPIDGVVFKYNDCEYYESLGSTGHHFRGGIAYKFYDEMYDTILRDVEWTMGRTGVLTPVAIFDAIDIEGTEVTRASLHNVSIMQNTLHKLNVCGWNGQRIQVYKANQIIPQIGWAEEDADGLVKAYIDFPHVCPICCGEVQIWGSSESDTQILMCVNPQCGGKLINCIEHFTDMKKGLAIKGLSKATIEKLIDWGWLDTFEDLYKLKDHMQEWSKKSGFGTKSVKNILNAIEKSRNCKLENFISAIGIPLIGLTNAKEIVKHCNNFEELVSLCKEKFNFEEWSTFGPEKMESLWNYDFTNALNVYKYLTIEEQEDTKTVNSNIKNMVFCVTGKVHIYKNRDEISAEIEKLGGKVTGSVTKNTNYLINNDINSTSAKNKKAKELDIPIITEEQFQEIAGIK